VTVIVTLRDGVTVDSLRSGDVYVKHRNGALDVVRSGVKRPYSYAAGEWTDVQGDEKKSKTRFWG
jgi:hypothetical protein